MLREQHLCKSIFKQTLISQKSVQVSQWLNCINGPNSSLSLYPCSLPWDFTVPFTRVALRQNDNVSVLSLFIRSFTCFSHLHLLPWQCHECPNWPSWVWETWNKAKSPQSSQPAPKNVSEPLRFGIVCYTALSQQYITDTESQQCSFITHYYCLEWTIGSSGVWL